MKYISLPLPELGVIAATRGLGGAGVGMLLSGRMNPSRRKALGWSLLAVGVLSTVPLIMDVVRRSRGEA